MTRIQPVDPDTSDSVTVDLLGSVKKRMGAELHCDDGHFIHDRAAA